LSKTNWGTLTLPFNLSIIGMTNCVLRVEGLVLIPVTYTGGVAKWQVAIPDWPMLLGAKFYQQGLVPDATANAHGATLTNAGEAVVGCR
jgi:hypothetical protein